jgi:hypothetical protein
VIGGKVSDEPRQDNEQREQHEDDEDDEACRPIPTPSYLAETSLGPPANPQRTPASVAICHVVDAAGEYLRGRRAQTTIRRVVSPARRADSPKVSVVRRVEAGSAQSRSRVPRSARAWERLT